MKSIVHKNRLYLWPLLAAVFTASAPAYADRSVTVSSARGLNIRTADGEVLCAVPNRTELQAVGRHGDGERLKVRFKSPGCPVKEGFVSSNYVRATDGEHSQESLVEPSALSFRTKPNLDDNFWKCSLPKNTRVTILPGTRKIGDDASWVKVKLNDEVSRCPITEGYVAEAYLKGVDQFEDLPIIPGTQDESDVADCGGEGCSDKDRRDSSVKNMDKLSKNIGRKISDDGTPGPFVDGLKKMIKNRKARPAGLSVSRGLVQLPLNKQRGPCGSFHYNPDKPLGVDSYANPLTACVFTAVMQDWKKNFCPSHKAGCRIAWGDISHKSKALFNTHRTHTDGYCIDIRPMQEGGFADQPVTYRSGNYDRKTMAKFVQVLKKYGGSSMYFNDTRLGTRAVHGHHNHIHVCFKDSPTTRAACDNLKVDPNVCPELQ